MSYAHEYCLDGGKKSLLAFSRPFSPLALPAGALGDAEEELDWLMDALDTSPHVPVAPPAAMKSRRRTSRVELLAQDVVEWPDPRSDKTRSRKPEAKA